jgi:tetratricopeptide (TPR) repeat protein
MLVAKQSRKNRKRRSVPDQGRLPTSELLQVFTSSWAKGTWLQALSSYRAWTSRTGRKRDPNIEGELLFRSASSRYAEGMFQKAVQHLDEALRLDPERKKRYLFYRAICLVKDGMLQEGREAFAALQDTFHAEVLAALERFEEKLPQEAPEDVPFETGMLVRFWKGIEAGKEIESASKVLQNLTKAHVLFSRNEDPEPVLKPIKDSRGVEQVVCYLMLLFAIYNRRATRVRNIITGDLRSFGSKDFGRLLNIHLVLLLREKKYNEILALESIVSEHQIPANMLKGILYEVYFQLGIAEINEGRAEKALDHFLKIQAATAPVIHNIALLYQRLERYGEANEYWIRLHRSEKKPKKTDPEDTKLSYACALKYIARNYMDAGEPDNALPYLKEAVNLLKNDVDALLSLQMAYVEIGQMRKALQCAQLLHEIEPRNEEFLLNYVLSASTTESPDVLIPLFKKALKGNPDNDLFNEGLVTCLIDRAFELRSKHTEEARNLTEEAKQIWADCLKRGSKLNPKLAYLEALFLQMDGKVKEADRNFRKVAKSVNEHSTGFRLGKAFYEDGRVGDAVVLFKEIAMCDCVYSGHLFENSIEFLAEYDDRENAELLCNLAVTNKGMSLYDISSLLMDFGKPGWALSYSSMLIKEEDADEDDLYLHLLILNDIGDKQQTLQFADTLHRKAMEFGDAEEVGFYKHIIKEIKRSGKFRTFYE